MSQRGQGRGGQGRGQGGQGRGQGGQGRGQGGQGRGQGGQGRGQEGQGRGQGGQGRGQGGQGRGQEGQGRGQGGQGRGQGGQGRGQGGQGRGQGGQGRGQEGQGRGQGGQGRGQEGQGRGQEGQGRGHGRMGGAYQQEYRIEQERTASGITQQYSLPPVQGAWGKKDAQSSPSGERTWGPSQAQQPPQVQAQPLPTQQQTLPKSEPPPKQRQPSQSEKKQQQTIQQMGHTGDGDGITQKLVIAKGGTSGKKVEVYTNHFAMKLGDSNMKVYQYDVVIDPDRPKKKMRTVMEEFKNKHYPQVNPAYDGSKSLYSANKLLPFGRQIESTVNIMLDGRAKEYKVQLQMVAEISMSDLRRFYEQVKNKVPTNLPQLPLQVIDVVLRHTLSMRQIPVGASLYSIPPLDRTINLGNGMHMYRGMYQSAILGWTPFLNVDVANKAFPSATCIIDLIKEFQGRTPNLHDKLQNWIYDKLSKHLRTLKVLYEIPKNASSRRNYRVNGVLSTSAEHTFEQDGRRVDVVSYYKNSKGYNIQYPNMPLLWVGSLQNKVMVPCELCTVLPGQPVNRKCDAIQTRNMIRECATHTDVRKDGISRNVATARYNEDPVVREFGLQVSDQMEKVDARILTPPQMKYKNNIERVSKGVWQAKEFLVSGRITNGWTVLNLDRYIRPQDIQRLVQTAIASGRQLGMDMSKYESYANRDPSVRPRRECDDLREIFLEVKKRKLDLVFIVLPGNNDRMYSFVKLAAEIAVGCLTQCIKSDTLQRRMNAMTMTNILMKVNAKLAGSNHYFAEVPKVMKNNYVMLMGADVTHPSPDIKEGYSVAAVTASHCPNAFGYNICWRLQPPTQEIILDMEDITRTHLLRFYQTNNARPEKVIVFRDGVSTGQFKIVLRAELQAIRRACKKMSANYEPSVTFIVVQKRHHTRFFPVDKHISQDKNCNVPAGTIVDQKITNPTWQDFYLVSHASIQGVAKPTKYVTLWDDSNISDDDLEELTYYLCHMFSRCTRSVSYPAPTYYAHLGAARGKAYCDAKGIRVNNLEQEQLNLRIQDCIIEGKPMFFV